MSIKISVQSTAYDAEYGGEQILEAVAGEYQLSEIFRLPFFRIIIDEVIGNAVCFRLMEGGVAHYFVLDETDTTATFSRETSIGEDNFVFEYIK
jgi:hypothetical protein